MSGLIIIGGIVLIIILIIAMILTSSREQTLVEDRLNQYLGEQESDKAERDAQRTAITDWVSNAWSAPASAAGSHRTSPAPI